MRSIFERGRNKIRRQSSIASAFGLLKSLDFASPSAACGICHSFGPSTSWMSRGWKTNSLRGTEMMTVFYRFPSTITRTTSWRSRRTSRPPGVRCGILKVRDSMHGWPPTTILSTLWQDVLRVGGEPLVDRLVAPREQVPSYGRGVAYINLSYCLGFAEA